MVISDQLLAQSSCNLRVDSWLGKGACRPESSAGLRWKMAWLQDERTFRAQGNLGFQAGRSAISVPLQLVQFLVLTATQAFLSGKRSGSGRKSAVAKCSAHISTGERKCVWAVVSELALHCPQMRQGSISLSIQVEAVTLDVGIKN